MSNEGQGPAWARRVLECAEDLPRAETEDLPRRLPRAVAGRYHLEEFIAEGSMSLLFRATQVPLGRQVVVKIMRPVADPQRREEYFDRFVTEAAALARVNHPNVVTIHDYGQTESGDAFIAMEYLRGRLLSDLIGAATPVYIPQAVHIAVQIARAIRAAHQEGALHRDLKAANVMLVEGADEDDFNHVKVIDFGLARLGKDGAFQGKGLYGSPRYMAPEQIVGESVDPRSDIYGLGILVFAMVAGVTPFEAENSRDILMGHLHSQVPSLGSVGYRRSGPPELEYFVQRCLEKRPEARYQSMSEVVRELKRIYLNLPSESGVAVDAQGLPVTGRPVRAYPTTDVDRTPSDNYRRPPKSSLYDAEPQRPSATNKVSPPPAAFPTTVPDAPVSSLPRAEDADPQRYAKAYPMAEVRYVRWWPLAVPLLLGLLAIGFWGLSSNAESPQVEAIASPAPGQDLRLELESDPTASQVFEEGVLLGVTPLVRTYPESARGTRRTFQFRRPGFRPVEHELELKDSQRRLQVSLTPEAPPPPEPVAAPPPEPPPPRRRTVRRPARVPAAPPAPAPVPSSLAAAPDLDLDPSPTEVAIEPSAAEAVPVIEPPEEDLDLDSEVPLLDDEDVSSAVPALDEEPPIVD